MTSPVLEIRALTPLEPGDRLLYDCPNMSSEFGSIEADAFFRKYKGQEATYNGPAFELVGLLDGSGRLPGKYCNPKGISVTFADGTRRTLNVLHFIVLEPRVRESVGQEFPDLSSQRLGDLPEPIAFYPGDKVTKHGDLLGEMRTVQEVSVSKKDGSITHGLAEQDSVKRSRLEQERKSDTPKRRPMFDTSHLPSEYLRAPDLLLVERGHLYHAYNEPAMPEFENLASEVDFWFRSGISKKVLRYHEFAEECRAGRAAQSPPETSEEAIAALRDGRADILRLNSRRGRGGTLYGPRVEVVGESDFEFASLLPPFERFREQARSASIAYFEQMQALA